MFCENCSGELRREKKQYKCDKCGAVYGLDYGDGYEDFQAPGSEQVAPRGFSSKRNIIIIIIATILALGIGIVIALLIVNNSPASRVNNYLVSGEKYLIEMNYEQAVIEFQRVLEIEPMNVDAYLGLAEAYIGLGEIDKAIEVLQKGFELTGDSRIKAKLDELLAELDPTVKLSWIDLDANIVYLNFGHYAKRDGELWRFCDDKGNFVSDKKYKYIEDFAGTENENYSLCTTDDGRVFSVDKNYNELFELENPDKYTISEQDNPLILMWHIREYYDKEYYDENDRDYLRVYSPKGKKLYSWNQNECVDGCGMTAGIDNPMIPEEAKSIDCNDKYHFGHQCTVTSSFSYQSVNIVGSKIYVYFEYDLDFDWDHKKEEEAINAAREEALRNGGVFAWSGGSMGHSQSVYLIYNLTFENEKLNFEKCSSKILSMYNLNRERIILEEGNYIIIDNSSPTTRSHFSLLTGNTIKHFTSDYDIMKEYDLANTNYSFINNFVNNELMICGKYIDENRETAKYALFKINWEDDSGFDLKKPSGEVLNSGQERISDFYDSIYYNNDDKSLGYCLAKKGNEWVYISLETGKEIAMYDDASDFSNGYAVVTTNGIGHVIDKGFNVVSEDFPCEGASIIGDGSFRVQYGDKIKRLVIEK